MSDWTSPDGTCRILIGDVRERLRDLPDESVHCVVTSPPYWGLRDYGTGTWEGGDAGCDHAQAEIRQRRNLANAANAADGGNRKQESRTDTDALWLPYRDICGKCGARRIDRQLGLERVHDCLGWATGAPCGECYICRMVDVFREVRRVLRSDGVVFCNLGDSFASSPAGRMTTSGSLEGGGFRSNKPFNTAVGGLKPKDLCGIPWRFALAAQEDGWYLRSDIIWHKPNPMPESVTDRPTKAHEYLFLLTKSARYFWDAEAVKESGVLSAGTKRNFIENPDRNEGNGRKQVEVSGSRNARSVWTIPTAPYPEAHFATYPPALVEPCVKAGTSENGCCPTCGAPWRRVVEKKGGTIGKSWHNHENDLAIGQRSDAPSLKRADYGNGEYRVSTLGWQPSCTCGGEPVPCVVLDPFGGSGTTGQVARLLGRHAILCELSAEYTELAKVRIMQNLEGNSDERPLLLEPARQRQMELL